MAERARYWFPRYIDNKKVIVDLKEAKVLSTNPVLVASVLDLTSLMLVMSGYSFKMISEVFGCSTSEIANKMSKMRDVNHTHNGNLYNKAEVKLGLLNPMALRGLAVRVNDQEKRAKLLRRVELAADLMNDDLMKRHGQLPFASLPDAKSRCKWLNHYDPKAVQTTNTPQEAAELMTTVSL